MIEIHTDFLHPPAAILLYQIIDVSKYNRIPASSHFIPQSFQRDVLKALACFDRAALQCWVGRHAESKLLKWEPHWVHVNLVPNGTSHHHHHRREIGRVFGGSLTCRVALRSSGSLWLKSQRLIGGRCWLNLGHILSLTRTLKLGWWKHLPTNQGGCWRCFRLVLHLPVSLLQWVYSALPDKGWWGLLTLDHLPEECDVVVMRILSGASVGVESRKLVSHILLMMLMMFIIEVNEVYYTVFFFLYQPRM